MAIKQIMLDLNFSKPDEIVKRLCERLRMERLAQEMTQADVAGRAGIGTNTVSMPCNRHNRSPKVRNLSYLSPSPGI